METEITDAQKHEIMVEIDKAAGDAWKAEEHTDTKALELACRWLAISAMYNDPYGCPHGVRTTKCVKKSFEEREIDCPACWLSVARQGAGA